MLIQGWLQLYQLRHWAKRCLLLRMILVVGIAAPESSSFNRPLSTGLFQPTGVSKAQAPPRKDKANSPFLKIGFWLLLVNGDSTI